MGILLRVLQVFLALHTAMGAVWKISNWEQVVPSLKVIPYSGWMALSVVELLAAACLLLPSGFKPAAILTPVSLVFVAGEMLVFCGLHLNAGDPNYGPMVYWLVVAAACGFLGYGHVVRKR